MDVNHLPLLEYVASKGKPVILSTGLATLGEIERALGVLRRSASVALLHCVSIYPSPPEAVHLNNMETLRRAFDVQTGYSDHTLGIAVALAAIALGATIVEKHFTTDKTLEGWDHAISADPYEFAQLVREGRNVVRSLGSYTRTLTATDMDKRKVFRRRIVLRRELHAGERIAAADVDFKRPGTGIHPDELSFVVGRTLKHDMHAEDELEWTDIT
jgi:N-acetylneuraminate synthase